MENSTVTPTHDTVITPETLLKHWQGHRGLTRRVIEAFPEDQFSTFSIGGMRPFSDLAFELVDIADGGVQGAATGDWGTLHQHDKNAAPLSKKEILERWDAATEKIEKYWPMIQPGRFQEEEAAFGQFPGTITSAIFYFIDNEIHHRGQGYVYLRALGIEPPYFWQR